MRQRNMVTTWRALLLFPTDRHPDSKRFSLKNDLLFWPRNATATLDLSAFYK